MAEGRDDEDALQKSLAHLKRRALDVRFELDTSEYIPQENIGIGAYGVVCSAIHKKTNDRVAIKKIPSVFDVKDVAKRTYREIKILKHFKHDNIIHIREILKPKCSVDDFKDVYVVFDLMESDLHRIIYSKQELSEEHVRYFLYQILRGLKYIHSAHVVHRDLKPSNLLVNEDCQLRVGDFGMSRGVSSSPQEPNYFMTQYVATRWYRAPEIMLSLVEYGTAVDMWSVGCIFAEMLGRKPLFPGKDYISQIRLIVGVVGSPKEDLLQLCHSPIIKNYFKELGHKDPVPWPKLFPTASKKAINLLSRMLVLHPKERLTVEQALVHPYLNKYHDPDDEPICVPAFNFDFEKDDMTIPEIREAIHQEAMEYHQPRTPTFSFNAFLRPVPKSGDKPPDAGFPHFPKADPPATDTADQGKTTPHIIENNQEPSQQVPVLKSEDGEVFKKPLSAKNDDSQVRIDTSQLKLDSQDIEMLSAKSTDGTKEEKPKENREPGRGHKQLISQDTKALVKAALLNANLRKQRLDSVGEDEKPRTMTAAMRQREREEKRKEKKKKSAERRKKEKLKKAKGNEDLLTSQDKELLMRWAKMQTVNVPIAPKPEIHVEVNAGALGGQKIRTTNVKSRSSVEMNTSVPTNGPAKVGALNRISGEESCGTAFVEGQGQGCKTVTQMFGRTVHKGPAAQRNTISLLQQHLRSQVQGQTEPSNRGEGQSKVPVSDTLTAPDPTQSQQATGYSQNDEAAIELRESNFKPNLLEEPKSSSSGYSVDFSTVNLSDLDFLTMMSTPKSVSELNSSMASPNCYTSVTSVSNSQILPKIEVASEEPTNTEFPSGGFLQKLCSESVNIPGFSQNANSQNFLPQSCQQSVSPSHISPNSQSADGQQFFSNRSPHNLSPNLLDNESIVHQQPISHQSPEIARNLSPHQVSPEVSRNISPHHISPEIRRNISPNHVSPSLGYSNEPSVPHPALSMNQPFSQNMSSASFHSSQFPTNSCVNTTSMQSHMPINTCMSTTNAYQQQKVNQASQMSLDNQLPFGNYMQQSGNKEESNIRANPVPGLFVNTKQAQMPYRQLFQDVMPGPSGASNQGGNHVQLDLAALAKQLSKSNMEDLCPPLALTPKGTGGGYGVGVDVDSLMVVSQDGDGPAPEPSPLSSSILADWMEVTGNMNIDMDALEQELQSPMALSYNDLNLYSS